ncbi:MAG: SCO family protein [Alphaproteobacteria bacterium]|nr:SCO family protein [Alphaproteobacteria bacterium]
MKKLKLIRWIVWLAVAVLCAALLVGKMLTAPVSIPTSVTTGITAPAKRPFTMVTQQGKPFTEKELADKPSILFFGFTSCPAICPGALADMTIWLEKLGADATKVHAVFISLDPERDTVKHIASYLKSYDSRIIGLTGTPEQVAAIAKAYGIYYKKMPPMDDGDYMVDHSASLYLYDTNGQLISTIDTMENRDIAFAKIKKLIDQQP